jgi:hypothetical protein
MSSTTTSQVGPRERDFFVRLRYTPLRDVARGRVTGRLDINARLDAAGLPKPLTDLVRSTVGRTRLWSLERAELAEELIAHFRDALEAGAEVEHLQRTFGDPRRVAVLIRRAKKRNRPAPWRHSMMVIRATSATVGLLLVLYLGYALYFFAGDPQPSINYYDQINAPAKSLDEAERGWPIYREALILLEPTKELRTQLFVESSHTDPIVVAFLERNAEALAITRRAAEKPGFGFVHGALSPADRALWTGWEDPNPSELGENAVVEVTLPYLSELRRLARLLAVDARYAAATGDGDRVVANVRAIFGMAEHTRESPFIINDLVANSMNTLASRTVREVLAEEPIVLRDEQVAELAHLFAATRDNFDIRYDGERWFFRDIVQRLYTDNGSGGGHMTNEGVRRLAQLSSIHLGEDHFGWLEGAFHTALAPATGLLMASREELTAKHAEFMNGIEAEARKPLWDSDVSRFDHKIEQMMSDPLMKIRYMPLAYLMPALSKAYENSERSLQEHDAALVALAVELYRRRTGAWPTSLADLVPQYLPETPPDRFTGRPLNYALVEGAPVIYSVGTDRDDDGGIAPRNASGTPDPDSASRWMTVEQVRAMQAAEQAGSLPPSQRLPDGDWVLWRPANDE